MTGAPISLAGFPMLSQRDADPNADYDCVPASIAACMEFLTGRTYSAGEIKDAVYGVSYTGGTAASAFVDYCAAQGVTLTPVNGTGGQLVTAIQNAIADGHPALITEPDPYESGWTHVCAAYSYDATSITVMDPWIAQPVVKSNSDWAAQLQDNQIWVLELNMLTIEQASAFFTSNSDGSIWTAKQNSLLVGHGILNYYTQAGGGVRAPLFGLTLFGLPRTNEIGLASHPGVTIQIFERAVLCYDPGHVVDDPPGSGDVYTMHIDQAQGPAVAQLLNILGIQPASSINLSDLVAQLHTISTATTAALKDAGVTA